MNLTNTMGTSPQTVAAFSRSGEEPRPPAPPQMPTPVDVDSLLATFAIGAHSPTMRVKAGAAREAHTRLVDEAKAAATILRGLGQPCEALERAIGGVGG